MACVRKQLWALVVVLMLVPVPAALAQTTTVVDFDSLLGQTDFSEGGANFTGGQVQSLGALPLYSSGLNSYHVVVAPGDTDDVVITFDEPVDSVTFFFVHSGGIAQGTARAFDSTDTELASVTSLLATVFNDPANFVTMDPASPIAKVTMDEGAIDDFEFTTLPAAPAVPTLPIWGVALLVLALGAASLFSWRRAAS